MARILAPPFVIVKWQIVLPPLLALLGISCDTSAPLAVQTDAAGRQYVLDPAFAGSIMEFTANDGAKLGYVSYQSSEANVALIYLHGIGSHAGWFSQAASLLRDSGYDVYCLDRRGSGINRENRGFISGHVDAYEILLDDIRTFVQQLRQVYASIFLVGLSWGGKLALSYGLTYPAGLDGLVLITPGLKTLVDVSFATKLKILWSTMLQPQMSIPTPIEAEMFTTSPHFLAFIRNDPLQLKYTTARFLFQSHKLDGYIDRLMPNNRLPILLLLAGGDSIIDNGGVKALLERGQQSVLDVRLFEEQMHSIQFEAPGPLVQHMQHWFMQIEE